jgi:hypothetical protein
MGRMEKYFGKDTNTSCKIGMRRFKAFFGCSPKVCSIVWDMIKNDAPSGSDPKHLLWTLVFLKGYETEHKLKGILGEDEKTIRKWIWTFVTRLALLKVVKIV